MSARARIHPLVVRITHWINAAGIGVMILSGWAIYNAHPIFAFSFPQGITLGGGFIGALRLHFAAMWLVMANTVVMIGYGLTSRRYWRRLWPVRLRDLWREVTAAFSGRLGHEDLGKYNAVQKSLYVAALMGIVGAIVTGLAIWKPVQFQVVVLLLGDFDSARVLHFLAMAGLTLFIVIHVTMALLVPRSILAMLRGS
jgi:thiosulfate reductase cytochrome b subunit